MMGGFTDVLEMAIGFGFMAFLAKLFFDYLMRRKLIDKGLVDENVKYLFLDAGSRALTNLKWGMVLIGIGAAVIIGRLAPYRWSDELTISGMFILAGLALVIYYFLAPKKTNKREERSSSEQHVT